MNSRYSVANTLLAARFFFLTCVVLLFSAGKFLFQHGYIDSFKILNHFGNSSYDGFFLIITYFGNSLFVCSLISVLLAKKYPVEVLTCWLLVHIAGLMVQVLKRLFFMDWGRPALVLGIENIYTAGNPEIYHTFPSGHACTAFAVACWCAVMFERKFFGYGVLAAIVAGGIAYSRIYLGVHFLGDILAGGTIGIIITAASYSMLRAFLSQKLTVAEPKLAQFLFFGGVLGLAISIVIFSGATSWLHFS